jgi:serine/threonine-protein kinase RsbW
MQPLFDTQFASTEMAAREALIALKTALISTNLTEDQISSIEIAVAEATNNVVEHAYPGHEAGPVQIACHRDCGSVVVCLSDRGAALPDLTPPEGKLAEFSTSLADLPEGGFGWFLIRELVSDLRYQRIDGSNFLRLTFAC